MLFLEPIAEVVDGGRLTVGPVLADRIPAAINMTLEPLGLFTSCRDGPIRPCTDRETPLTAVEVVIDDECFRVSGSNPGRKTRYQIVVVKLVTFRRRFEPPHELIRKPLRHDQQVPVSVQCPYADEYAVSDRVTDCQRVSISFTRFPGLFNPTAGEAVSVQRLRQTVGKRLLISRSLVRSQPGSPSVGSVGRIFSLQWRGRNEPLSRDVVAASGFPIPCSASQPKSAWNKVVTSLFALLRRELCGPLPLSSWRCSGSS